MLGGQASRQGRNVSDGPEYIRSKDRIARRATAREERPRRREEEERRIQAALTEWIWENKRFQREQSRQAREQERRDRARLPADTREYMRFIAANTKPRPDVEDALEHSYYQYRRLRGYEDDQERGFTHDVIMAAARRYVKQNRMQPYNRDMRLLCEAISSEPKRPRYQ
jgi:hypothetical protein